MDRPTPTQLTVTVQLQLDGDSFTGHADADDGAGRDFSGWLGLIATLDELIDGARERAQRDGEDDPQTGDRDARSDERGVETSC